MKVALLGNSQFAVSTAWGLCQSEMANEIVFVSDVTSTKIGLSLQKRARQKASAIS